MIEIAMPVQRPKIRQGNHFSTTIGKDDVDPSVPVAVQHIPAHQIGWSAIRLDPRCNIRVMWRGVVPDPFTQEREPAARLQERVTLPSLAAIKTEHIKATIDCLRPILHPDIDLIAPDDRPIAYRGENITLKSPCTSSGADPVVRTSAISAARALIHRFCLWTDIRLCGVRLQALVDLRPVHAVKVDRDRVALVI